MTYKKLIERLDSLSERFLDTDKIIIVLEKQYKQLDSINSKEVPINNTLKVAKRELRATIEWIKDYNKQLQQTINYNKQ